uniref:Uncharacterized protein n=1 Tax=Cyanistes caeruleus TaxID=156563 RepID=A0A8C0VAI4_CYACU
LCVSHTQPCPLPAPMELFPGTLLEGSSAALPAQLPGQGDLHQRSGLLLGASLARLTHPKSLWEYSCGWAGLLPTPKLQLQQPILRIFGLLLMAFLCWWHVGGRGISWGCRKSGLHLLQRISYRSQSPALLPVPAPRF